MCGIAGIVGKAGPENPEALERASRAMVHRGPDGSGTWESPPDASGRSVLLAHRRLSILDLSPAGAQPMVDPESGAVLVYNGEVYNFRRSARATCRAPVGSFGSTGDTAVVLRRALPAGPRRFPRLRGMFALGLLGPGATRPCCSPGIPWG